MLAATCWLFFGYIDMQVGQGTCRCSASRWLPTAHPQHYLFMHHVVATSSCSKCRTALVQALYLPRTTMRHDM